ncbi:hypothetical protein REPUB_Repub13aG0070600 [Reevesia pubescens]
MEDDTWSFAFSASSRSYQSTLKSQSDLCIDFEEIEEDDELKTKYPCPYCSEDFDLLGLCYNIDEEHYFEAGYGAMHSTPMYIAETSPSQIRGLLISLKEFFIVLGMVAGYGIGSLLVKIVVGWLYMYRASTPLALIMGIGMWWLLASPRWLLLRAIQGKGNMQELRETVICCLCQLRGQSIGDSASEQVDEILTELSHVGEEKEATLGEMFHGKCMKALIIGAGLILFQHVLSLSKES